VNSTCGCRRVLPFALTKPDKLARMGTQNGRPSKGRRDAILAKPPVEFGAILKQNADAAGLSYGEYLVMLAADALGMPQYAPPRPRDRAAELPIPELNTAKEATTRAA